MSLFAWIWIALAAVLALFVLAALLAWFITDDGAR